MMAMIGCQLARAGWHAVLPDLGGTGDSEDEFSQARVDDWLADLHDTATLAAHNAPVKALIAVRLGACLASRLLPLLPGVEHLVLWQPVVAGQQHLTQFLRLQITGNALARTPGPTVADMRATLAAGESLEVGGYQMGPGLARDLDALTFVPPAEIPLPSLHWLEVSGADPPARGPLADKHIQQWSQRGGRATAAACRGDPFWSTVEITLSQELLDRTVACLVTRGAG
jgi:exosortase A-associated hydrolase 2